ncbi:unnamed protein product [Callosobruchus maculatus]|uniref:Malate dehydrogenase n=1 Tax=Callosobruchus maculatus TaxID=64391 RepID=A0A653C8U6_CALMS|nr:unnamed protein product [Callosobruchus maculatus]
MRNTALKHCSSDMALRKLPQYAVRVASTTTQKNMASESVPCKLVTPMAEAKRFMVDCFIAVGAPQSHAETVADNLLEADYRGHYSHGMNRLEMYVNDVLGKQTDPVVCPVIEKESVSTALVDGKNGFGAVVGKFCMEVAIEKAKKTGIGLVVAHGSNHYGIAAMYALQAIKERCLGMSFTNTSPFMVPTRAKQAALGTNPLSLGCPGTSGDSFLLDMATTAVAVGKLEIQKRKGEPLPEGWAMNNEGKVETNAEVALGARKLMPLGGTEINSGYKGYGLGMLVEIFSGILSGSAYGPNIRKWGEHDKLANLGNGFLAIDHSYFAPGFEERMSDLMDTIRNMEPVDPDLPVLAHGDKELLHMHKVEMEGGLSYVENQHNTNAKLAEKLKVQPMASKSVAIEPRN